MSLVCMTSNGILEYKLSSVDAGMIEEDNISNYRPPMRPHSFKISVLYKSFTYLLTYLLT